MVCFRDSPVAIGHKNKAADGLGGSKNALIQKKIPQQSKNNWQKVGKSWASKKGHEKGIETWKSEVLNKILSQFMQQFVRKTRIK